MKKALIIIGAVFAGLALLAIVGSMLPSDEPQKVVVVQETVEATPTEPAEVEVAPTAPTLTTKEQRIYDFISLNYPKLVDLRADFDQCLWDGSSNAKRIRVLVKCSAQFVTIAEKWNEAGWGYGRVADLEDAFDDYVNATKRWYKNWVAGVYGSTNTDLAASNAIKAEKQMNKIEPRVEARLADIEDTIY